MFLAISLGWNFEQWEKLVKKIFVETRSEPADMVEATIMANKKKNREGNGNGQANGNCSDQTDTTGNDQANGTGTSTEKLDGDTNNSNGEQKKYMRKYNEYAIPPISVYIF